jgi:methylmalonyl-CoA/ethylmalonyl-CoA epimerase
VTEPSTSPPRPADDLQGLTAGARLHHIGIVVPSLDDAAALYVSALGATPLGDKIHDPLQRVRLLFLRLPDGLVVELIQPAADDSPVNAALARGGGVNHFCFEVDNLEAEMARLRSVSVPAGPPKTAVAFGGRRVVFMLLGRYTLIELLEAERPLSVQPDDRRVT